MRQEIFASSRKLRRKRLIWKLNIFLLIFALIIAGIMTLFYWSKFEIEKISIKTDAASFIDVEEITAYISNYLDDKYLNLFPLRNILLFPKERVKNDLLKDFLRIREIVIDKDFPQTISIEIKERKQEALLCYEDKCSFLDEDGFIFEKAPFFSGSLFVKFIDKRTGAKRFSVGEQFFDESQFKKLILFKNLLKDEHIGANEIILKDEGIYNIVTSLGWFILLNENNEAENTFENLKITLDEKIKDDERNLEYIDLRFGNKMFYKFK